MTIKKERESRGFSPVPGRAMLDGNLSALDLRVLMCVAGADRFGANGTGCFMTHKTMAIRLGCHQKSITRSMHTLAEAGLIEAKRHPLNKKTLVYSVLYNDNDKQAFKSGESKIGNETVTDEKHMGNEMVTPEEPIGNKGFEESQQNQEIAEYNILGEALNISRETKQIYADETASIQVQKFLEPIDFAFDENPGRALACLDRAIKNGDPINDGEWYDYLTKLMNEIDNIDNPVYGMAYRLSEEVAPF